MAKKVNDRPLVSGGTVSVYPNPRYYGLKGKYWNQVQRYVDEIFDIRDRVVKIQQRASELQQELQFQQRKHEEACIVAARKGEDEPDGHFLDATRGELEKVETKRRRHEAALTQVNQELRVFLQDNVPQDVLDELREKARQHEERYKELVAQAQAEKNALGTAYSLHLWVRGIDARGYKDEYHRFQPTPQSPSPMPQQQDWSQFPLNWGEQEYSEVPIMEVRGS
jgi:hypothetical protein